MATRHSEEITDPRPRGYRSGWLAAGGLIGAALASTCCVIPLLLVTLGVTGAWIGKLTFLEPYNPAFSTIALLCVGLGFRQVYFRREADCDEAGACATSRSRAATKTILWLAGLLTLIALTTNWWAPLFY